MDAFPAFPCPSASRQSSTMPAAPSAPGGVQRVQPATAALGASNAAASGSSRGLTQDWNPEDLQKVVLEYLTKKGFHKAETMLRLEASQMQESKEIGESYRKLTDPLFGSASEAYELLRGFIQQSLDIYKGEMARILWPTFAYMFMDLLAEGKDNPEKLDEAKAFFEKHSEEHELQHRDALLELSSLSLPEHLESNKRARLYRSKKYRLTLSRTSLSLTIHYLMEKQNAGGQVVLRLMNRWLDIKVVPGMPTDEVGGVDGEALMDHEGVDSREPLSLGPLPMNPDMMDDVQAELREEDARNGVDPNGDNSLTQAWSKVKREPVEDSPARDLIPLPTYKGVDVEAEVEVARQLRKQIRLGPQAAAPSVAMYTFFHTHDGMNCVDFNHQQDKIAAGFSESYIRIWNLSSERRGQINANEELDDASAGRSPKMIGHSAPVYSVSWSPTPAKSPAYLLTGSGDKTIRLWSADTYKAVVVYKGHSQPVWDVKWGPFGQYFVSGSGDATGRIWSVEHINPMRILVGHLGDIECVNWHPNSAYVVTGSSDKTCRLYDIQRGSAVRLYTGHTGAISCVEISPDGKLLATAAEDSHVHVYDINSAKLIKSFRSHTAGSSIYSLAFSKCSSVLLSGGSDCSVRVWDVKRSNQVSNAAVPGQPSSDLLATYYTKQTPVYKLAFTGANVACAAGAFTLHDN